MIIGLFHTLNRRSGGQLIRARTAGKPKMLRIIDWSSVSFSMVGGKMVLRFTNNEKEKAEPTDKRMRLSNGNSL